MKISPLVVEISMDSKDVADKIIKEIKQFTKPEDISNYSLMDAIRKYAEGGFTFSDDDGDRVGKCYAKKLKSIQKLYKMSYTYEITITFKDYCKSYIPRLELYLVFDILCDHLSGSDYGGDRKYEITDDNDVYTLYGSVNGAEIVDLTELLEERQMNRFDINISKVIKCLE
jgi:hypothetical protein